jgi:predicted dehydrogenase
VTQPLRVAVIGCGLIGMRRAEQAARHDTTSLVLAVDTSAAAANAAVERFGGTAARDWQMAVDSETVDVVVVATPNAHLHDIAVAALDNGKHVLIEKPMGCNLDQAESLAHHARKAHGLLKIGFNHRYHPALRLAHERFDDGAIGEPIALRARYGHGGRPGYENEWRGDARLAGGGELTDQGVHVADLTHWFVGMPAQAFAYLQTAVWPIAPLEDNAFGLLRYAGGCTASIHTSWTQWKNLFSFEIFGTRGSLAVEGLGGSYGVERLVRALRNPLGGPPAMDEIAFEGPDESWSLEWDDFIGAILRETPYWGTPEDGLAAMRIVDALYRSARANAPVTLLEDATDIVDRGA